MLSVWVSITRQPHLVAPPTHTHAHTQLCVVVQVVELRALACSAGRSIASVANFN